MARAQCYLSADEIRTFIMVVGKEFWGTYPYGKDAKSKLLRRNDTFDEFLTNNCPQIKGEISEELTSILAGLKTEGYLQNSSELRDIYELFTRRSPFISQA